MYLVSSHSVFNSFFPLQILFKEGYNPMVYLWDIWWGLEVVFKLAEWSCSRIQLRLKLNVVDEASPPTILDTTPTSLHGLERRVA